MCEQDDAELVDEEHLQVEEQHVRLRTSRRRRRAVGARPKELVAMEECVYDCCWVLLAVVGMWCTEGVGGQTHR